MKPLARALLVAAAFTTHAIADDEQPSPQIVQNPDASWDLQWWGIEGRTYFVQASDDLVNWSYADLIESGHDTQISYEVGTTGEKLFVRLAYTDQPALPDPESADFDGDGLSNAEELGLGTDPFSGDSDGDGLPDNWEVLNSRNPLNADENANGVLDGEDDDDSDGYSNHQESVALTSSTDANDFPREFYSATNIADGYPFDSDVYIDTIKWDGVTAETKGSAAVTGSALTSALASLGFPTSGAIALSTIGDGSKVSRIFAGSQFTASQPPIFGGPSGTFSQSRFWMKAPSSASVQKFIFPRVTVKSFAPLEDGEEPELSADTVTFTISAGETWSSGVDLSPVAEEVANRVSQASVEVYPPVIKDIKDHSNLSDDVGILPWDDSQPITEKNIAWIEAHASESNPAPRMPQLEFSIPNLPAGVLVEARLEVKYDRGNGSKISLNQDDDTIIVPNFQGSFRLLDEGGVWKIWDDYNSRPFFGGLASIKYKLVKDDENNTEILPEQEIHFRIGGKNPVASKARTYIQSLPNAGPGGNLWFCYAIAKQETKDENGVGSRYNHFLDIPHHTHGTAGLPFWNNDGADVPGGYGLFQVTGNTADAEANIPAEQIWNWQKNAEAAANIIRAKRSGADAWMIRQKNSDNADGTPLHALTVEGNAFVEGTSRTMVDAVTIKYYNGASAAPAGFTDTNGPAAGFIIDPQSGGHYCYWKNGSGWALSRFNRPNDYPRIKPFNYVLNVCKETE